MRLFQREKTQMVSPSMALAGRGTPIPTAQTHFVTGRPLSLSLPENMQQVLFGMGCFWGVERIFWQLDGVWITQVGYAGGYTPNPTYEELCTGKTGHNEVVRVVFDPSKITFEALMKQFWEGHDPTQGMRQGNDLGTQYRSGVYTYHEEHSAIARSTKDLFQAALQAKGYGQITTEILPAPEFYAAEDYHQQYLAKNPNGYCGIGGTGAVCPIGLNVG